MRWLLLLIAVILPTTAAAAEPVANVTVERNGSQWSANYTLLDKAPVWVFTASVLPRVSKHSWRLETVEVLTPGVNLQRLGNYDALVSDKGPLPKHVQLTFTPYLEDIEGGYDPALAFSDGSVALYMKAFKVVPLPSRHVAETADANDDTLRGIDRPTRVAMHDRAGAVLFKGERMPAASADDEGTYVLFGPAKPVTSPGLISIIDPKLPDWFRSYLTAQLPAILETYSRQLGPAPGGEPMLMVSWSGAVEPGSSMSGSVLPGLVVMTIGGKQVTEPNDRLSQRARWFVSHEAAHFWLGQAVHYSEPSESWITEGGAELLAFRATAAADPTFDIKARLSEAKAECTPFLANGGIADAYRRENDRRAYYACGTILALAAEKASGGDFADFVRTLIKRYGSDETVTRAEWLALLDERAPGGELSAAVSDLLDHKHADPKQALDDFILTAGISDEFKTAP